MYLDKNNVEIKAGMIIHMGDGSIETVYATNDANGNPDLGINASNEAYLTRHPDCCREYYSLSYFNMRDVEVIPNRA